MEDIPDTKSYWPVPFPSESRSVVPNSWEPRKVKWGGAADGSVVAKVFPSQYASCTPASTTCAMTSECWLVVVIVAAAVALCQCRLDRTALIELALPAVLRLLFVVYPLVTNVAFAGFPCYEFEDGSTFLKKDVSIACDSPYYENQVAPLAVAAIVIYPIGLIALNFNLLVHARKAIIGKRKTMLCTATSHQTCGPFRTQLQADGSSLPATRPCAWCMLCSSA